MISFFNLSLPPNDFTEGNQRGLAGILLLPNSSIIATWLRVNLEFGFEGLEAIGIPTKVLDLYLCIPMLLP